MRPEAQPPAAPASRLLVALRVGASPARAFEAFVGEIGLWWRPDPMFRFSPRAPGRLAFEPRLGGRFTETFADGEVFEIGRITAWAPGERLGFTWRQASFEPGQATQVEVRFEPVEAQTRITVEHRGWDGVPQAHAARHTMADLLFARRHADWWRTLLASLRARLDEETPHHDA